MANELEPQSGESAEQFKLRIEKKQGEITATKGSPLGDGVTPGSSKNGSDQSKPNDSKVEPTTKASESVKSETPQAINPPEKKENVNPVEWARSKGLTSEEAIARSLRAMEEEFHKRNQGKWKKGEEIPQQQVVPPSYQPPARTPSYGLTPPPPISYQLPRPTLEYVARQYNLTPEDAEKLIAFNTDFVEAKLRQRDEQWQNKWETIEKENSRNSEFRQLMQDPVFKHPQVQEEIHRVLSDDPTAFEREPETFKWAYQTALSNMARKNLQASLTNDQNPNATMMLPTKPPTPNGTGGAGSAPRENEVISPTEFADLPLEEKAKILDRIGARSR